LPGEIDRNGRFADCACRVEEGLNFVQISAILNYKVYLETIEVCGIDGSDCQVPDKAPICEAIRRGKLIPPARLISTYHPDVQSSLATSLAGEADTVQPPVTSCPEGPHAACMTAPCRKNRSGDATCSCPVFYGPYQLFGEDAQCDLAGGLVNSSSYSVISAE
jgi:hypothetical protein